MKDYLESQKVDVQFPREVIKEAFRYQLITDGDIWMDMLDKQSMLSHTYDEASAENAVTLIARCYAPAIRELASLLKQKA